MSQYIPVSEKDTCTFLNNFFCHFNCPGHELFPEGLYRTTSKNFWNTTFNNYAGRLGQDESYDELGSEKKINQTPSQFYSEIDEVTNLLQVDTKKVTHLILEMQQFQNIGNNIDAEKVYEGLDKHLRPIYLELRNRGYNPEDLVT
jgi:hypothetical protein